MREDLLERGRQLLIADAANPVGCKFNLGTWAEPDREDQIRDPSVVIEVMKGYGNRLELTWAPNAVIPVSCGTQACAMGLFAISKAFEPEGLSYDFINGALLPKLGEAHGFTAACALFEITGDDAKYLFNPDCYDTCPEGEAGELLVAQRIADFINGIVDEHHHPGYDEYEDEEPSDPEDRG